MTYFVVPVLVVDGVGPIEAVKRLSRILQRTWGESVAGEGGLGIISFLLLLPALLVFSLAAAGAAGTGEAMPLVLPIAVLYVIVLSVVFTALGAIFRTGTYIYATTGNVPSAFDLDLLHGAFHTKD